MRRYILVTVTSFLVLLPRVGWGHEERARVGAKSVGDLEIVLYVWSAQEVIRPKGDTHHQPAGSATHHLDVTVYDFRRGMYVPYLNVKATVSDLVQRREFTIELEPMIGEWLHYGANVTLPHPGKYSVLVDVEPPDIARYKHLSDVWSRPAQAVFTYEYR